MLKIKTFVLLSTAVRVLFVLIEKHFVAYVDNQLRATVISNVASEETTTNSKFPLLA
jgi:phage terminase large subunit-like protein